MKMLTRTELHTTFWDRDVINKYVHMHDEARLTCLHPELLMQINSKNPKRILDFGCGDGKFINTLNEKLPNSEIVGIDINSDIVAYAYDNAENPHIEFLVGDENVALELGEFDLIVCSLVLMMSSELNKIEHILTTLSNLLVNEGQLIVAVTHPCFRHEALPTIKNILPKSFNYWNSGCPYEVHLESPSTGVSIRFIDYHWTIEDYVTSILKAGNIITGMTSVAGSVNEMHEPKSPPAYLIFNTEKRHRGNGDTHNLTT